MPKRRTSFNAEWSKEHTFVSKSSKDDLHAYCTLCRCDVDVSTQGKAAIERHASKEKHKYNRRAAGTSSLRLFFREATSSPEDDKISAAELCKVYHAVKHHQSYRSVDCGIKVDRETFSDSSTAKGMTCGKTKAKALCENVLSPYSVQTHTDYVKEINLYFSVATDASNKGTTKCFPVVLRYLHFEEGVQHVLLDFYSDSNETSEAITNQLLAKLEKSGLNVQNMSAYAADNASVNYGKHNSVYQKLKLTQKDVLPANCLAHILHNATRYAAGRQDFDVENAVLKVYSHFSVSASRTAQLKEFCEFVEAEECNLLRHIVTRWLSLLPSIDRMLKFWKPLTSYFQSQGEEECGKILWKCFGEENTEVSETYFLFLSHILKLFSDTIEALEAKSFSITSVFKVMTELKQKLERRLKDRFFGFIVNSKLKQLSPNQAKKCEMDFLGFYERAKKYISERYDFSENSFHCKVGKLGLTTAVSYEEYSDVVQTCNLKDIDMDGLYEEYAIVEASLSSPEMEGCHSVERYLKLFSKADVPLVNLRKVSAYIFSIQCSNAYTERVFSMMTSAWRNERNRMDVDNVKAELQVCVNFTFPCTSMYQKFLGNKKLLDAARKGQKYCR